MAAMGTISDRLWRSGSDRAVLAWGVMIGGEVMFDRDKTWPNDQTVATIMTVDRGKVKPVFTGYLAECKEVLRELAEGGCKCHRYWLDKGVQR